MSTTQGRTAIACFGEALIDFLAVPAVAGQPRQFAEYAGGAPANVARPGASGGFVPDTAGGISLCGSLRRRGRRNGWLAALPCALRTI